MFSLTSLKKFMNAISMNVEVKTLARINIIKAKKKKKFVFISNLDDSSVYEKKTRILKMCEWNFLFMVFYLISQGSIMNWII